LSITGIFCRIEHDRNGRYQQRGRCKENSVTFEWINRLQLAVRIICAVGLLTIGFAHGKPAQAREGLSPEELALYALPDGSVPVICTTDDPSDWQAEAHFKRKCEACRISSGMLPPEPVSVWKPRGIFGPAELTTWPTATIMPWPLSPNTGPRAPPALNS
jgi:hypothetical protein